MKNGESCVPSPGNTVKTSAGNATTCNTTCDGTTSLVDRVTTALCVVSINVRKKYVCKLEKFCSLKLALMIKKMRNCLYILIPFQIVCLDFDGLIEELRVHLYLATATSLRHRSQINSIVLVLYCYTQCLRLQL